MSVHLMTRTELEREVLELREAVEEMRAVASPQKCNAVIAAVVEVAREAFAVCRVHQLPLSEVRRKVTASSHWPAFCMLVQTGSFYGSCPVERKLMAWAKAVEIPM